MDGIGYRRTSQQTQNICITIVQCWISIEDVGPVFYKCFVFAVMGNLYIPEVVFPVWSGYALDFTELSVSVTVPARRHAQQARYIDLMLL